MPFHTRITQVAKERGFTAAEVARRLGLYRSNLSAMDSGRRSVSLQSLARIAEFLDCSVGDLLEASWEPASATAARNALWQRIREREATFRDGEDRSWVHAALLAWQRHFRGARQVL